MGPPGLEPGTKVNSQWLFFSHLPVQKVRAGARFATNQYTVCNQPLFALRNRKNPINPALMTKTVCSKPEVLLCLIWLSPGAMP